MSTLHQYDSAIANYYNAMRVKTLPLYSFDFHHEYRKDLQNIFVDSVKLRAIAQDNKWVANEWDLQEKLQEEVVIVTDAQLRIVFASQNMVKMNGYEVSEVLGKSPKIFQGEATNHITSKEIRLAIQSQQSFEKVVMNYKKDGSIYACTIKGFPVFNIKGELSHYIAFEKAA